MDGRPSRRNKAALTNFSDVVFKEAVPHIRFLVGTFLLIFVSQGGIKWIQHLFLNNISASQK